MTISFDRRLRTTLVVMLLHASLALPACDSSEGPAAPTQAPDQTATPETAPGESAPAGLAPPAAAHNESSSALDAGSDEAPLAAAEGPVADAAPAQQPTQQPDIDLRLKSFSFVPAAGRRDQYFDLFMLQVELHNRDPRAIADLRGRIRISAHGTTGYKSVQVHARDGISASGRSVQILRIHYNPFVDWDRVLKGLAADDLRLSWQTEYCQFADGSRWRPRL